MGEASTTAVEAAGPLSRVPFAAWLAVFAIATTLRFWNLHALPFDPDEVWEVTHHSAGLVEQVNRVEGFPPLHGWVLGLVMAATGSEGSARVLSALLGLATVSAAAWIGDAFGGRRVAWWAGLLLAVSPMHVAISRSARPYSLYLFVAALAIALAVRLRAESHAKHWGLFAAACWLVAAASYPGGLLVVLLIGLVLTNQPRAWRPLLATIGGLALASLPLFYCLWIDLVGVAEDYFHQVRFGKEQLAYTYLELLTGGSLGPSVDELSAGAMASGVRAMAPWAAAAFLPAGVLAVLACRRQPRGAGGWLIPLLIVGPFAFGLLSQFLPTGYGARYVGWLAMPTAALLALGAAVTPRRPLATLATLGLIAVNLASVVNRSHNPRYATYDFRPVRRVVEEEFGDAPILSAPPYLAAAVRHHFQTPDRLVIDAFATPLLDQPDERQRWRLALESLNAALGDQDACPLVLQTTVDKDARQATFQRFVELLDAQRIAQACPRVDVYRIDRQAIQRALQNLGDQPSADPPQPSPRAEDF